MGACPGGRWLSEFVDTIAVLSRDGMIALLPIVLCPKQKHFDPDGFTDTARAAYHRSFLQAMFLRIGN